MVISLMSMLLWKRIQLPSRLWSLHTFCRVLFSTVIMAFALFSPIAELRLALERNQGWAVYACQIRPPQGGSLRIQDNWVQNCAVLRARSVLTVMWVLLFLVEIFIAYRAKEFQSREGNRKHGHWSKARTDRLIKASMDSSSEIWSDEIVRVHNDDHDEIDVDDSNERDNDYDHDNEDTSSQHDLGQQRSSLQEHRYSHPPPEYHYAYRVEVLEPALPPFVYNPFLAHSDCSFACFDTADSVTTASSITISSIGSSDSRPDPYRNQNGEVSEARHHGCM
ncbi:hypothetical protein BGZ75_005761 [Mortierella antarctica]|nr:hypothetical protein BGZ75_005761 [Mortierella antarctica]